MIEFSGRQDNLVVREAGMVGLAFNALMAIAALVSVTIFIPKQRDGRPPVAQPPPTATGHGAGD